MSGVPATTRVQLHISLVASKISTALGECENAATGLAADPLPFVRVFETELSMIQNKYAGEWAASEEVSFLDVRLSLYSYALHQWSNHPRESHRPANELITQSIITARQLLTAVSTFPDILSNGVFHVFRSTSYVVFFLLRILGMAPSQTIDEAGIRNMIRQIFPRMKDISVSGSNDRRFQCIRVCRIIEHMIDYKDWNKDIPFTGKAESFMANNFVADVAARGIIEASQRHSALQTEHHCEISMEAGVPAETESAFDLNFSIWDPMEWALNWQYIDDLLLSSDGTRAAP